MRKLIIACVGVAGVLAPTSGRGLAEPLLRAPVATQAAGHPRNVDHRYRIIGKVRLLLFWIGAEDVGGARITWSGNGGGRAVSLLIGSDPERAPRAVNEWGYIREDMAGDATSVFGIRTVTDGDSPDDADAQRQRPGRLAEFGVLCATVTESESESRTATVHGSRDATYRHLDRVLDVVERHARWTRRHITRPPGVAPGFLTALDLMMRASAASARRADTVPTAPRLSYVYKDVVYDLIERRVQPVPRLQTHAGVLHNLLRTEFVIRSRAAGSATGFVIVYGTEGPLAGVPVYAQYQPNWWFKVELELDEEADVPADPAGDDSVRRRIDALCGSPSEESEGR